MLLGRSALVQSADQIILGCALRREDLPPIVLLHRVDIRPLGVLGGQAVGGLHLLLHDWLLKRYQPSLAGRVLPRDVVSVVVLPKHLLLDLDQVGTHAILNVRLGNLLA